MGELSLPLSPSRPTCTSSALVIGVRTQCCHGMSACCPVSPPPVHPLTGPCHAPAELRLIIERRWCRAFANGKCSWDFTTSIDLPNLLPLEEDKGVRKYLGLAEGRPVKLSFGRYKSQASGETMFGSSLSPMAHFGKVDVLEVRISRGMNLQYKLQVGDMKRAWTEHRGASVCFVGSRNLFGKLWEEVLYAGSPYFPGGRN